MTGNVTTKMNSLVKQTKNGEDHNAFLKSGYVMEIQIVLMVLMKIQVCIIVLLNSPVGATSSPVQMDDASTR